MSELETKTKEAIEKEAADIISDVSIVRDRRMFAEVKPGNLVKAMDYLKNKQDLGHISVITGVDLGEQLEALYHLAKPGLCFTLRTKILANDNPTLNTITEHFPGAEYYERELEDMFGIKIEGLKPGNRYPLPDDWPSDEHPLRKNWKFEEPKKGGEANA
jgi:membrane-bound hydrogenase subunit beta